ncbi:CLAVATA3/ESR (CLE)-related protein TDIF-like [Durio zibethinus]|uniref:CLAVATA3/ESR (CLE)-related protein TDIF-like n=1 Tax=Durio zibethinus TaxID=66656 RepID=A0A6P6A8C7_DURZI|nr:CLAVATA3/ESR (CLE)-related protein TDIF-like [Durio zibethinus]
MDIDPFWITGGWFHICHNNFMATANKSISETSSKSQYAGHALLLFLVLLLISPLFARPAYFSKVPIYSSYRQLFSPSSPSSAQKAAKNLHPFSTSSTPATTHTRTTRGSSAATDRQFKAAAHEVPSGPNPESNK